MLGSSTFKDFSRQVLMITIDATKIKNSTHKSAYIAERRMIIIDEASCKRIYQ
jgi:hypothetical protein